MKEYGIIMIELIDVIFLHMSFCISQKKKPNYLTIDSMKN